MGIRRPRVERLPSALPPPLPPSAPFEDALEARAAEDETLGEVVADVVDALGATMTTRLELLEERIFSRARLAGLQGLGVALASIFLLAAWACGAVALGLWLRGAVGGPAATGILAGVHVLAAGITLLLVGLAARRSRRST
jgi:hypothetical protein